MVRVKINGQDIQAREGQTVLEVAREHNIEIPVLCYNEGVKPYGACRLCIVEVSKRGRKRLVISCMYPVEDDLEVLTNSETVVEHRRMIMQLLLARCPDNEVIKNMAGKMGVNSTPFKLEDKNCILCGLCVRACEEVVGASAISFVSRGVKREVASPFLEPSDSCIGCGSCVYVCPINAIKMEDVNGVRILTFPNPQMQKVEFSLKKCKKCGAYWAPEKQLAFISRVSGVGQEFFDMCPDCRD